MVELINSDVILVFFNIAVYLLAVILKIIRRIKLLAFFVFYNRIINCLYTIILDKGISKIIKIDGYR